MNISVQLSKRFKQKKELSLRAAAATYEIPRSTLSDHLHGVSSKRYGGGSTLLTSEEEWEIVVTCQVLAEMGFPLTKDYVEVVVHGCSGFIQHV